LVETFHFAIILLVDHIGLIIANPAVPQEIQNM